ncbi:hypothetical protein [Spirillospora sp. NPDC047279]|uniref:nSTAND1 domain-containing NTPase n=1 Tax=Spirillospora sp. NPDC047279 TaxID=3155478 RepID=UPI0033F6AE22
MSTRHLFVGPRSFSATDNTIFHGRADETVALSRLWRRHRVVILHGPPGVGKTSLLQAGVLDEFGAARDADVPPAGDLACPAGFPLALWPGLDPFVLALLTSWFPSEDLSRVAGASVHGLIRRHLRTDRFGAPLPVFAAVDRADLLFQAPGEQPPAERGRRFAAELAAAVAAHPGLHLLLAVRTRHRDELAALLVKAGVPDRLMADFPLRPLTSDGARRAVAGPVSAGRHPLAASAEALIDDLRAGAPGVSPALLQIVCDRLWRELPAGDGRINELNATVDQILTEHYRQAVARVAADHNIGQSLLLRWLRQTFGDDATEASAATGGTPITARTPAVTRMLASTRSPAPTRAPAAVPSGAVLRALEDVHLLHVGDPVRLSHPRLQPIIARLEVGAPPLATTEHADLAAAEAANTTGELELAEHHAMTLLRHAGDTRIRASAECLLGTVAWKRGDDAEAIAHYEAATRSFGALGDSAHVGVLLAAVGRLKIGDGTPDAVNHLRAALTQLPGDLHIKIALALAFWYAGRAQAAIAILDDALARDGGTPEALRLRGELLADLDRPESALRDLDRVDYSDRPSSRAAWMLAVHTSATSRTANDGDLEIVADAGDSGPVLLRVARTLRLEGDADAAAGLAERAVKARRPPLPPHLHKEASRLMAR